MLPAAYSWGFTGLTVGLLAVNVYLTIRTFRRYKHVDDMHERARARLDEAIRLHKGALEDRYRARAILHRARASLFN